MGSTNVVVLDISSDEEPDPQGDEYSWLSGVIEAVEKKSEDLDDVFVVSELMDSSTGKQRSSSLEPRVDDAVDADDDDDDDCVVLEGDPDKLVMEVEVDNAAATDDLLLVRQKGQIACRDFPHSRHSCAIYPFSSTPHEKYCKMCHCYVCDTRAPCPYWCVGVSTIDHCHANDKEEIWKNQRRYFKTGGKSPLPVSKPDSNTALHMIRPQLCRGSTQGILGMASNSSQCQVSVRACSSTISTSGIQNIRTRCDLRKSRNFSNNQRLHPRSQPLLTGVRNNIIRKDRGLQSLNKTSGTSRLAGGCSVANLSGYAPPNHNQGGNASHVMHHTESHSSLGSQINARRDASTSVNLEIHAQQNISRPNSASYLSHHVGQNTNVSSQNQSNVNRLYASETQPAENCQKQGLQQPGVEDLPRNKLLLDVENWLLDNQAAPWTDPVGLDESTITFDFETLFDN